MPAKRLIKTHAIVRGFLCGVALSLCVSSLRAKAGLENPIVQTRFTTDPAPLVYQGTVFLYTGHDEDDATGFKMLDWKLYTTTDMVNWTDRGTIASLKTFPWAVQTNDAWAAQVVERHGKFFLYAPISVAGSPKNVIAVAVSDSPLGPFRDALGKPLIAPKTGNIDPTVFVDNDGQAYLYWGNPDLWYVKLNEDMVSYSGPITKVSSKPFNYQEGPWFYRRDGHYYLAYSSHCCPEGISYAMSDSPVGPFTYEGMLMEPNNASSGNHPGIIDYKGHTYLFGFTYELNWRLTNEHRERRSVSVSELHYNHSGTINTIPWFEATGVAQLAPLSPYVKTAAGTMVQENGLRTDQASIGEVSVSPLHDGSWLQLEGVDFGVPKSMEFEAEVASEASGGTIELRLDSRSGPLVGILRIASTGGLDKPTLQSVQVQPVRGKHTLFQIFTNPAGATPFRFFSWRFASRFPPDGPATTS